MVALWWLTEELVILGLFSNSVELSTKVKMVEKLNSVNICICSKTYGLTTYGKPFFPKISANAYLFAFFGEDLWLLLKFQVGTNIYHLFKV